ncbi:3164_t:CDS:2, partial [Racocetra persica]
NITAQSLRRKCEKTKNRHDLGRMNIEYTHCNQEKIILPLLNDPPLLLRHFFESSDEDAREFYINIRQYNAAHAFISLGVMIDQTVLQRNGSYVFCVNGELCHLSSPLISIHNNIPAYAQLYIYNAAFAYLIRMN